MVAIALSGKGSRLYQNLKPDGVERGGADENIDPAARRLPTALTV
jgi:hypothetical protein